MIFDFSLVLTGVSVAVASSLFGVFVVLRRLALVADAISHIALPGMAIGLLYNFDPFWGALAFLLAGALLIFFLEEKTSLATETVVSVLFITALAVGSLLIARESLVESLFGSIEKTTLVSAVMSLIASAVLVWLILGGIKNFVRVLWNRDLARSEGLKVYLWHMLFLLIFAVVVALGIKVVGSLLMGALVVLPAASSKNIAGSLRGMIFWAVVFGVISVMGGIFSAKFFAILPGPPIILWTIFFFIATFGIRLIKLKS